jgi:hypothetical protein
LPPHKAESLAQKGSAGYVGTEDRLRPSAINGPEQLQ